MRIYSKTTGRLILEQKWGFDADGAARSLAQISDRLAQQSLEEFCDSYGIDPSPIES